MYINFHFGCQIESMIIAVASCININQIKTNSVAEYVTNIFAL